MWTVRRWTPAAPLIAAALVLTACASTGEPVAQTSTPTSPPATPPVITTTPTVSPPPSPTDVRAQVLATVREYFDAANYAIQTGDTTRLKAVTDPGCPCYALVKQIEKQWEAGERSPGARLVLDRAAISSVRGNVASVEAGYHALAYNVLASTGRVARSVGAHAQSTQFVLVSFGGAWHLTQAIALDA